MATWREVSPGEHWVFVFDDLEGCAEIEKTGALFAMTLHIFERGDPEPIVLRPVAEQLPETLSKAKEIVDFTLDAINRLDMVCAVLARRKVPLHVAA